MYVFCGQSPECEYLDSVERCDLSFIVREFSQVNYKVKDNNTFDNRFFGIWQVSESEIYIFGGYDIRGEDLNDHSMQSKKVYSFNSQSNEFELTKISLDNLSGLLCEKYLIQTSKGHCCLTYSSCFQVIIMIGIQSNTAASYKIVEYADEDNDFLADEKD
jgi:hypothetical protein